MTTEALTPAAAEPAIATSGGGSSIVHRRATGKQSSRQRRVVELRRQRPAEAAALRPLQVAGNRARTDDAGLSDRRRKDTGQAGARADEPRSVRPPA